MIILAGVPVVVQLNGVRERLDQPADTETRLSWEQQLDRGDAVVIELDEPSPGGHTHKLISQAGGWFYVTLAEGERVWPELSCPPTLSLLLEMGQELTRMMQQMETLLLANQLLEAQLRDREK